jgi:hypothetical protein
MPRQHEMQHEIYFFMWTRLSRPHRSSDAFEPSEATASRKGQRIWTARPNPDSLVVCPRGFIVFLLNLLFTSINFSFRYNWHYVFTFEDFFTILTRNAAIYFFSLGPVCRKIAKAKVENGFFPTMPRELAATFHRGDRAVLCRQRCRSSSSNCHNGLKLGYVTRKTNKSAQYV